MALFDEIQNLEVLLALEPEELAPAVLRAAIEAKQNGITHLQSISYYIFERPGAHQARFPADRRREADRAIGEAWSWLVRNGLLIPDTGMNAAGGWMIVTPRGEQIATDQDALRRFQQAQTFPKSLIHPLIANKVWKALVRGELEDAVFAAFKAVEIAVRDAAEFGPGDIGVKLMRKAFDPESGPLTDKEQPEAEREALAHLFVGAIGSYKNPHSHRTVTITEVRDAQEMVILASHLLGIVDARRKS
jgi:uncharacterized protein (TIGR02391 family)